jgi:hypothetical protein
MSNTIWSKINLLLYIAETFGLPVFNCLDSLCKLDYIFFVDLTTL